MSNELVKNDYTSLPTTSISRTALQEISKANEFLGRIQLYTKGRAIDTGTIAPGHYGVPQSGSDGILDLGGEIDVLVFAARAKAMNVSDLENIVVSYNPEDEAFQDIKSGADAGDNGNLYGHSFLLYERSTSEFYELFCCNKSARIFSPTLLPFLSLNAAEAEAAGEEPHGPIPATLGVRYAKNKKGSWHASTVKECKAPFTQEPPFARVVEEVTKFLNPEVAEDDDRERTR